MQPVPVPPLPRRQVHKEGNPHVGHLYGLEEGETMSELPGLAFLLAARGRDSGLSGDEIVFLLESQIGHLEMVEALKRIEVEG